MNHKNYAITEEEKESSISYILSEVDLQPTTFRAFLRSYFQEVGFRYLFWGIGDILFIVGLLLLGVGILSFPSIGPFVEKGHPKIYFTVFMTSPLCYALLYFLVIWKERLLGTFELKMTLRVSLKELFILRMLVFSGISLVISVGSGLAIWQLFSQELSLMRLFSLSFSSLFLFANLQLLFEFKIPMRVSHWLTPLLWGALVSLLIWQQETIIQFLVYVPVTIVITLVCGLCMLFICLLRRNYFIEKEGTIAYVSA